MTNSSFGHNFANVLTIVVGLAFFAVTTVGLAVPASALAAAPTTQTAAR